MRDCATIVFTGALTLSGALSFGTASAAATVAYAETFVNGTTLSQSTTGDGTTLILAEHERVVPSPNGDAFIVAQSSAIAGFLGAVASARSTGVPGGFRAVASANWTDSFTIQAGSLYAGTMGTFSGAVVVSGDLSIDEFLGRFNAITEIQGGASVNGTSLLKRAELRDGYDTPLVLTGDEGFSLFFDQVPFTFGQPIGVSLGLFVLAGVDIIDAGATGRTLAVYNETMRWDGLSEVTDAAGRRLAPSDYSAISDSSGFDFDRAAPVPEPSSAALFALGLLALGCYEQRRRRPFS